MLAILLRGLFLRRIIVKLLPEVLEHFLKVELWLFLDLRHKDVPCVRNLLLAPFKVLPIFRIEQLRIPAFDLFVVLQKALIIYQVFKCFADLFQINGLICLNLSVDLALGLQHIRLEQLHSIDVLFAACPSRSERLG